jgi:putative transposase
MSSTYLSLHYHLVFGTKNRIPSIDIPWRSRLHEYMGGTVRGLGGFPEGIGGTADHVHLLVALKSSHCLADVMRELKKASSAWVHEEIGQRSFAWHSEALHGTAKLCMAARICGFHSERHGS